MNDLDIEWLQHTLAQDAAYMTQLIVNNKSAEADAYLHACNYNNRLAAWKAARA